MGSGSIGVSAFSELCSHSDFEVVGLVSRPDGRAMRGSACVSPPMKSVAKKEGVEIYQPFHLEVEEILAIFRRWSVDLVLVMDYGQILPSEILNFPDFACLNVHSSLLPQWRGASCIQATILSGRKEGGITFIQMNEGLDSGDIVAQFSLSLSPNETGETLHQRLSDLTKEVIAQILLDWVNGEGKAKSQNHNEASFAPKLLRKDGAIDWSISADSLERMVRAYHPWPATFAGVSFQNKKQRLKIFPFLKVATEGGSVGQILKIGENAVLVACGKGSVWINLVQLENKKQMSFAELIRGYHLSVGDFLLNGDSVVD